MGDLDCFQRITSEEQLLSSCVVTRELFLQLKLFLYLVSSITNTSLINSSNSQKRWKPRCKNFLLADFSSTTWSFLYTYYYLSPFITCKFKKLKWKSQVLEKTHRKTSFYGRYFMYSVRISKLGIMCWRNIILWDKIKVWKNVILCKLTEDEHPVTSIKKLI